jgi:hypothetical protein
MSRYEFGRFVAENSEGLLRTAYLIVWDLPQAEDLVQETLLRVAKRWPKVRRMDHPVAQAKCAADAPSFPRPAAHAERYPGTVHVSGLR